MSQPAHSFQLNIFGEIYELAYYNNYFPRSNMLNRSRMDTIAVPFTRISHYITASNHNRIPTTHMQFWTKIMCHKRIMYPSYHIHNKKINEEDIGVPLLKSSGSLSAQYKNVQSNTGTWHILYNINITNISFFTHFFSKRTDGSLQ